MSASETTVGRWMRLFIEALLILVQQDQMWALMSQIYYQDHPINLHTHANQLFIRKITYNQGGPTLECKLQSMVSQLCRCGWLHELHCTNPFDRKSYAHPRLDHER